MRFIVCLVFFTLALVCGYGFLASHEPGTAMIWKVVYGAGACVCLILAIVSLTLRRRSENR